MVSEDVTAVETEVAKLGLQLNKLKCEITSRVNHQQYSYCEAFYGFQFTNLYQLFVLGSPVMPGSAIDQALEQKTNDLKRAISRLSTLQAYMMPL